MILVSFIIKYREYILICGYKKARRQKHTKYIEVLDFNDDNNVYEVTYTR